MKIRMIKSLSMIAYGKVIEFIFETPNISIGQLK